MPLLSCDSDSRGLFAEADEGELDQVECPSSGKDLEIKNGQGIGWIVAAYFIVADIAGLFWIVKLLKTVCLGGGVVTMPKAMLNSGTFLLNLNLINLCRRLHPRLNYYIYCLLRICLHWSFTRRKLANYAEKMACLQKTLS